VGRTYKDTGFQKKSVSFFVFQKYLSKEDGADLVWSRPKPKKGN